MAELMEKEKRVHASHIRAHYKDKGIKLGRPNLNDQETAAEAINGFYRVKATPSMGGSSNGVCHGHVALPRSRFQTASANGRSDTTLSRRAESVEKPPSRVLSRAPSAPTVGSKPPSQLPRAPTPVRAPTPAGRSGAGRSFVSVKSGMNNYDLMRNPGADELPRPTGAFEDDVDSHFTSISQRPTAVTQSSLKNEVEQLVLEQMEKVVQPLQRRLGEEVARREGLERKVAMLTKSEAGEA